jgi:hypothetical protein
MLIHRTLRLLLTLSLLSVVGLAQPETKGPIGKKGLLEALRIGGLTTAELVQMVSQRGVDFQIGNEEDQELRAAGATPELIDASRKNYRGAPSSANTSPQALTNESVVKLISAGIGEDMIVTMVNAHPGRYSLGVDDAIGLKKAGVTDKILAAMIAKNAAGGGASSIPSAVTPAGTQPLVPEVGVYYKKNEEWVELMPEVVNWKTGGVLKHVASVGIVKGDVNGRLNGPNSRNAVRSPVEFLVYAPEGIAITEYQLLRLRAKEDGREFRTVTGGVLHVSGGALRDLVPFEGKKIANRTYTVVLPNLGHGEYGFLPPGATMSSGASSQLGKMYTFHLLE